MKRLGYGNELYSVPAMLSTAAIAQRRPSAGPVHLSHAKQTLAMLAGFLHSWLTAKSFLACASGESPDDGSLMNFLRRKNAGSPEFARIAPFAVFVGLTSLQGRLGPASLYWVYLLKTIIGAWMIWEARPFVDEMRWKISSEGLGVGVVIFVAWVGLDGLYPRFTRLQEGWNPNRQLGTGLAWFYIIVRVAGSSLVVPPLEEVFYRSFLYRYFVKTDFRAMPLGHFHALSFVATSVVFGLMHPDRWLAGILCGLAYQSLVVKNGRLGDAMTAHATTNFLLGIWVVWRGAWNFW